MTLEELYEKAGGDYGEVIRRFRMDKLVARFVVKFLDDTSIPRLLAAIDAGDDNEVFEAAHSAKGVCANLSLNHLSEVSSEICEVYRKGNEALRDTCDIDALVSDLKASYIRAKDAIEEFSAQ